jgi:hypothetical protein
VDRLFPFVARQQGGTFAFLFHGLQPALTVAPDAQGEAGFAQLEIGSVEINRHDIFAAGSRLSLERYAANQLREGRRRYVKFEFGFLRKHGGHTITNWPAIASYLESDFEAARGKMTKKMTNYDNSQ